MRLAEENPDENSQPGRGPAPRDSNTVVTLGLRCKRPPLQSGLRVVVLVRGRGGKQLMSRVAPRSSQSRESSHGCPPKSQKYVAVRLLPTLIQDAKQQR